MKIINIIILLFISVMLVACDKRELDASYPQIPELERRADRGKLTGEDGLVLFGGKKDKENGGAVGSGIGINSYLWRAALDTVSFMPLASADPFGGVIITDWYQSEEAKNEKFKINILILSSKLRTNALKVTVFKKTKVKGEWQDSEVNEKVASDLENKILTRARQLRNQG